MNYLNSAYANFPVEDDNYTNVEDHRCNIISCYIICSDKLILILWFWKFSEWNCEFFVECQIDYILQQVWNQNCFSLNDLIFYFKLPALVLVVIIGD